MIVKMQPASYLVICLASLSLWAAIGVAVIAPTPPRNCNIPCPQYILPICGSDGSTYGNDCFMKIAACRSGKTISQVSKGPCPAKTTKAPAKTTAKPTKKTCKKYKKVAGVQANSNLNVN